MRTTVTAVVINVGVCVVPIVDSGCRERASHLERILGNGGEKLEGPWESQTLPKVMAVTAYK